MQALEQLGVAVDQLEAGALPVEALVRVPETLERLGRAGLSQLGLVQVGRRVRQQLVAADVIEVEV